MTARLMLLALLLLAAPAGAQQDNQAQNPGAPSVQSTAPEIGPSGGGTGSGPIPDSSERPPETGDPRAAVPPPRPPVPTTEIPAGRPFTDRPNIDAAELELQRALRGGVIEGRVTIPDQAAGVLIQPAGRDWRGFRTRTLTIAGAIVILGVVVVLGALHLWKGPTRIDAGRAGRRIPRYSLLERCNHWMVAGSFVVLALTGLNITFGAYVLRPVIGPEAFTALTWFGQAAHQYLSFAFVLGLLVMLALWLRDNLPTRVDLAWLRAGGPLAKGHPPAGRFNAAQKALYWLVMAGGVLAAISGYLLMAPGLLDNVTSQQWAHVVHATMAMVLVAAILGHIYIGTIGTEGAFEAMAEGEVDWNYAREHHSVWLEEQAAAARQSVAPPEARPAAGD
jgi:formate dehydrogenase subunit gamma